MKIIQNKYFTYIPQYHILIIYWKNFKLAELEKVRGMRFKLIVNIFPEVEIDFKTIRDNHLLPGLIDFDGKFLDITESQLINFIGGLPND